MRIFAAVLAVLPSAVWAQEAGAAAGSSPYASLLPLVLIFFVFYFLLIKPQQKKMKEHQAMLAALKKGDEVVVGGIVGKVTKAGEGDTVAVEIAKGVEVSVVKTSIATVLGKETAVISPKKTPAVKNDNIVPSKDQVANDN